MFKLWIDLLERDQKLFLTYDVQQAFQLAKHFGFSVAMVDLDWKGFLSVQKLRVSCPDLPVLVVSDTLGVP